jgi:histidine triad (HIT) family protein
MADQQSPEEVLKEQKANCLFCKIAAGEVQSRKVYEDDRMLAILDINPAAKGHTLVLTKEHYPIMPLLPPEEFEHLFGTTAALSGAVRSAMIAQRCTTFIANGAVAGQQSPHFLFHLIPREEGDGLTTLTVPERGVNQSDLAAMVGQNLYAVMRQHLTRTGNVSLLQVGQPVRETKSQPSQPQPTTTRAPTPLSARPGQRLTPDQLARVIEENPEIKALLLNNPEKLQRIVNENPQFKGIFAGVDIKALGERLRAGTPQEKGPRSETEAEAQEEYELPALEPEEKQEEQEVKPANRMTMRELFAYIDRKPRLKEYLLESPRELKLLIPDNDRLAKFFAGSNVDAIIRAYEEHTKEKEVAEAAVETEGEKNAGQMTMEELFAFIDGSQRLREYIIYAPAKLQELIPKNEKLARFFAGSNVNAIIQAYHEHAKEKLGVRITVEPAEEKPPEAKPPEDSSRQEAGDAYEDVRDGTHRGTMSRGPR